MKSKVITAVAVAVALLLIPAQSAIGSVASSSPTPTVSPVVASVHVLDVYASDCATGYLCAWVPKWYYDSAGNFHRDGATLFRFFHCNSYSLHNWVDSPAAGSHQLLDSAIVFNHQTGGVYSNFYNQSGDVLAAVAPYSISGRTLVRLSSGWNPIWYINSCG